MYNSGSRLNAWISIGKRRSRNIFNLMHQTSGYSWHILLLVQIFEMKERNAERVTGSTYYSYNISDSESEIEKKTKMELWKLKCRESLLKQNSWALCKEYRSSSSFSRILSILCIYFISSPPACFVLFHGLDSITFFRHTIVPAGVSFWD